jgi:diaminopimelate epimerase
MVDNRNTVFDDSKNHIELLCHRRFGVGADGLILIESEPGFDFKMKYFNADGAEGSMCGNGGRCAVKFASDLGLFKNETHFLAVDGPHHAQIKDSMVYLEMIDVDNINSESEGFFLNTGSPHLVIFKDDISDIDVKGLGASIRYSDFWKERGGVNVNFVQVLDAENIKVRTYERGVEDETYSCGTGVTACALVSYKEKNTNKAINIQTLGGRLKVEFIETNKSGFKNIKLVGPAVMVFEGKF